MEYTKRDFALFTMLSENLNRYMSGFTGSKGLCNCLIDLSRFKGIPNKDFIRMEIILEKEFKLINPEYQTGIGIYMWEKRAIEPRQKFLDDLIEKIKNSLSIR